jgi:hypothetical protein
VTPAKALQTSILLAEKIASARPPSEQLRARAALADFAAFGLFKQAAPNPEMMSALQRGLGWGVGLGLPALGVGHMLAHDARNQGHELIRDARNQALLTAAGVGSMQGLGEILKNRLGGGAPQTPLDQRLAADLTPAQKLAAAIMVDDVLEDASRALADADAKYAALVLLARHRVDAARLLRSLLP